MIISPYNEKVPQQVVDAQMSVFKHFGIELIQVKYENIGGATGHGEAIDNFIRDRWTDDDLVIFDIDCIPLIKEGFYEMTGLFGAAQHASHIPNSIDYASPAFIYFDRNTFEKLGKPSFVPTERSDTGAELTYIAHEKGIPVTLIYPSSVEVRQWQYDDGSWFGQGTTYANKIYHAFHARWDNQRFINKCKEVCG
jgi:hypothetical protein